MEANNSLYLTSSSIDRILSIISESDNSFEKLDDIPSRDRLTFTNGFYTNCSAIFIDIRDSSKLTEKHNRPKLAKLFRSYISEIVAIMNGDVNCREINIVGDGVLGIFSSTLKSQINSVFSTAARLESVVDILNCIFGKNDIESITVGIGVSWGRALMIKAGYMGSGINDLVWMGDVVNEATKLASYGNKTMQDREIMVSTTIYSNLDELGQGLLSWNSERHCYHGYVINTFMDNWVKENCKN